MKDGLSKKVWIIMLALIILWALLDSISEAYYLMALYKADWNVLDLEFNLWSYYVLYITSPLYNL